MLRNNYSFTQRYIESNTSKSARQGNSWHKLYSMHLPVKRTWFFCLALVQIRKSHMAKNRYWSVLKVRNDMIWRIINGSQSQKRWRISIRKNKIYLESKFSPNRRIFVFWRSFLVPNGDHSKPKWSPYGAACLISCKYPFPLKSVHFWIFNDFFNFYIGAHFEMAAILKILKTKSTT